MKQRTIHVMAALLLGITALASFAPAADADCQVGYRDRGRWRKDRGAYRDGSWRGRRYDQAYRTNYGDRCDDGDGRYLARGRSDYYYDPYCDVANSRVSPFKDHYARCEHPPLVQKINHRTGRLVKTYAYDRGEWRDAEEGGRWSRRDGCDDRRSGGRRWVADSRDDWED